MSFQAPIGNATERASGKIWPGSWIDATPYLKKYFVGIHTGADLNMGGDADAHTPVYAIGDGIVTYARKYPNPNAWGNIIVIDHGTVDGKPLFSRYGHVESIKVSEGQSVRMGDQISAVGNGSGLFAYHLHFDISTTTVLRDKPGNWPAPSTNPDPSLVRVHYVDPKKWLEDHFGTSADSTGTGTANVTPVVVENIETTVVVTNTDVGSVRFVIATNGIFVRLQPGLLGEKCASLLYRAKVSVEPKTIIKDSFIWAQVREGPHKGLWVAVGPADNSEVFLSSRDPEI